MHENNLGEIEKIEVPDIWVRVIKRHHLKSKLFHEKAHGIEFKVLVIREGGYDVDMYPIGNRGERGFMHDGEVEVVTAQRRNNISRLSEAELEILAYSCMHGAESKEEIRRRLTYAGFDAEKAVIHSVGNGKSFWAKMAIWLQPGKVIIV